MRKKQLLELNTTLHNRLQTVTEELKKYKILYNENIEEINRLRRELAEMEIKMAEQKAEAESLAALSSAEEKNEAEASLEENNESVIIPIDEIPLDNVFEFASEIIGKIVLAGTKASNEFADKPNEYSKDLINLVLGKTEVCKSQIFDICNSNLDDETKRAEILKIEKDALEYFDNLYKQV